MADVRLTGTRRARHSHHEAVHDLPPLRGRRGRPRRRPRRLYADRGQSHGSGLDIYNHHRGHTALKGQPPAGRVPNLTGQYSQDSGAYYDRRRARGKPHAQALLRLVRHRISVLFAMLRDGTFYESRVPEAAVA